MTGNMPGIAASTSDTCVFGALPKAVEAPENSFVFETTWACTSMPTTISQSPVAPLTSFLDVSAAFIRRLVPCSTLLTTVPPRPIPIPARGRPRPPNGPLFGTNTAHYRDRLRRDANARAPTPLPGRDRPAPARGRGANRPSWPTTKLREPAKASRVVPRHG